jgi:hypothetical protein
VTVGNNAFKANFSLVLRHNENLCGNFATREIDDTLIMSEWEMKYSKALIERLFLIKGTPMRNEAVETENFAQSKRMDSKTEIILLNPLFSSHPTHSRHLLK